MNQYGYGYGPQAQASLADILDKVLDKGLVVAGDIRISLASVELLTIKVRLLLCSIDKAVEVGLDWWRTDGFLSNDAGAGETARLQARVEDLERRLAAAPPPPEPLQETAPPARPRRQPSRARARTSAQRAPDTGGSAAKDSDAESQAQ